MGKVSKELSDLEFFLKRRTAEGYWNIGRYVDEHFLEHKDRADYGSTLFQRLAKDVDLDVTSPGLSGHNRDTIGTHPQIGCVPIGR